MSEEEVSVVLAIAGHDPSGGAGIQADIETLSSMGCHTASVVTALTVQDTVNVKRFVPMEGTLIVEQARAVLEDMPVSAIKIGMLGSVENVEMVHTLLRDYRELPVVLDPIMAAGGGTELASEEMMDAMVDLLFPMTSILTPNSVEARAFAPEGDSLEACAHELLDTGCGLVLITGAHENTPEVVNLLYGDDRLLERFAWDRLPGNFHGSGCTLSSAIAGLLSHGVEPYTAIYEAQEFTFESLKYAYRAGMGQLIPNRFFWASNEDEASVATAG